MSLLTPQQEQLCEQRRWDFSDLRAAYINCTLKPSPERSNTRGLVDRWVEILRRQGVEVVRAIDHDIATGVWPDMTERGWERDEWPAIFEKVKAANILVISTPIWLGEKSSVCTRVIGRLYGNSSLLNESGSTPTSGRVGPLGDRQRGRREALRDEHPLRAARISATSSPRGLTPVGSARQGPGRPTSTPALAARRTTSPTATPRS